MPFVYPSQVFPSSDINLIDRTVLNAASQQREKQALKNLSAAAKCRKVLREVGQLNTAQSSGLVDFILC